ncbi:MAG: TRAP transporter substrate-binding protein [Ruminococcaceae bacterium]|jgi:tripartite ATP-independent transporter DctP family solute receptor|nr:TRAP transporter substrate-binding protein [Oscillospiraceae bacterium]
MKIQKYLALSLATFITVSLAACGGQTAQSTSSSSSSTVSTADIKEKEYDELKIVVGDIYNESTTQGQALNAFKDYVEKNSGGKIYVDIYHGGSLGSEGEHAQAQLEGSVDLIFSGTAGVGLYVPATAVFESWYAFDTIESIMDTYQSVEDTLDGAFQEQGFKLLGCYYDGPRQILTNKSIASISDLKGLKLRAPGSSIYVNSITALGANAISMSLGDVYTSLQTGAIDAMEGTVDLIVNQKFYEQAKYLVEDSHVYQPLFVTYNLNSWNKLSADTQQLIREGVTASEGAQLQLYIENLEKQNQILKDAGIEFLSLTDRDTWVEAVSKVSADYAAEYGELGQSILDAIQEHQ